MTENKYIINANSINNVNYRSASFDVGIKNMALCIFDISNGVVSIVYWDVLNLIKNETQQEKYPCTCALISKKKGEPTRTCGKNAKYTKNNEFFCEKHAKMSKFLIPQKCFSSTVLKKGKVEDLISIANQNHINVNNLKTKKDILACLLAFFEKHSLESIKQVKVKSAGDIDLISIGRNMKIILNEIPFDIDSITHTIIENQISPIANRMKTIQGMLAQYFIMQGSDTQIIEFVSSANKLRGLERDNSENEEGYKQRKKDGIYHCEKYLEHNASFSEYNGLLTTHKKSDDLADCFLQGIWYLRGRLLK